MECFAKNVWQSSDYASAIYGIDFCVIFIIFRIKVLRMTIQSEDIVKALNHISDADQLQVTIKGSFYGSLLIGMISMIFSVILGPVGLMVGGILGSIVSYMQWKDTYKPLSSVLRDLTPQQCELFYRELEVIHSQITVQDYLELVLLLQGTKGLALKKQLLDLAFNFVKKNLGMDVKRTLKDDHM